MMIGCCESGMDPFLWEKGDGDEDGPISWTLQSPTTARFENDEILEYMPGLRTDSDSETYIEEECSSVMSVDIGPRGKNLIFFRESHNFIIFLFFLLA